MKERNEFLEQDGLYWESETHEWFRDITCTQYAQKETTGWGTGVGRNDSLNVACFVIRNKTTGEYDRVMMDVETNNIIYETKSLEDLSSQIDKLKIIKRFT